VKRSLTIVVAVVAVTACTAAPAMAFWSSAAQSTNGTGSSKAVTVAPPSGTVTAARPSNKVVTFTVAGATTTAVGYHVLLGTTAICSITGANGSCSSAPDEYAGGRDFTITSYAGPWSASITCSFHDANDKSIICA
jgi:hypothetical protein